MTFSFTTKLLKNGFAIVALVHPLTFSVSGDVAYDLVLIELRQAPVSDLLGEVKATVLNALDLVLLYVQENGSLSERIDNQTCVYALNIVHGEMIY